MLGLQTCTCCTSGENPNKANKATDRVVHPEKAEKRIGQTDDVTRGFSSAKGSKQLYARRNQFVTTSRNRGVKKLKRHAQARRMSVPPSAANYHMLLQSLILFGRNCS